jgi:hypothetical protein
VTSRTTLERPVLDVLPEPALTTRRARNHARRVARVARVKRVDDWPLSLLVLAVPTMIGALRILRSFDRAFTSGGDVAFIELAVRQALHGGIALGPYSRFGWHHPGPAVFYLLAPVYWLGGERSRALFLGSWLINASCLLAIVWIVRARVGEAVARITAAIAGLYAGVVGFESLINPWNPSLLAAPMLLLLVAVAAACTGSTWSLVVAGVAGSYLVQTHVGTLPLAALLLAIGVVGRLLQARSARRARASDGGAGAGAAPSRAFAFPLVVGLALLAVMWVGPVLQQFAHDPGNMRRIVDFYRHPPATATPRHHTLRASVAAVSDRVTTVPLGDTQELVWRGMRVGVAAILATVGVLVGAAGWRLSRFLAWTGILGTAAMLVAVFAASRVIGPLYPYLFRWTDVLGLPAIIGATGLVWIVAGARLRRRAPEGSRWGAAAAVAGALAMVALAVLVTRPIVAAPTESYSDSPDARAIAAHIERLVGHDRSRPFQVRVVAAQFADGPVLLELAKHGYRYRLTREMDLYRGTTTSRRGPVFELRPADPNAPASARNPFDVTFGTLNLRVAPPLARAGGEGQP